GRSAGPRARAPDAAGSIALGVREPRGRQGSMRWASALSQNARLEDAVVETAATIREALSGTSPDLVAAFVSAHHRPAYFRLGELIQRQLPGSLVLGCTAFGVIGDGHEVEGEPALSLTAASLPGVDLQPFRVEELPSGTPEELRRAFGIRLERPAHAGNALRREHRPRARRQTAAGRPPGSVRDARRARSRPVPELALRRRRDARGSGRVRRG